MVQVIQLFGFGMLTQKHLILHVKVSVTNINDRINDHCTNSDFRLNFKIFSVLFWGYNYHFYQLIINFKEFYCDLLSGHTHWILHIAWSPDGKKLASGCKNGEVRK